MEVTKNDSRLGCRLTGLTGSPLCGKTTIRKVLKAASCYLHGFLFYDMSDDVIAWHEDPANGSPFFIHFNTATKNDRKQGSLINDDLINRALGHYLRVQISLHGDVRHILISGFPRTDVQIKKLFSFDPEARIAFIDTTHEEADTNRLRRIAMGIDREDDQPVPFARRWTNYESGTKPVLLNFGQQNRTQFIWNDFGWTLRKKAALIANRLHATPGERASLIRQINLPGSPADEIICSVEKSVVPNSSEIATMTQIHPAQMHTHAPALQVAN